MTTLQILENITFQKQNTSQLKSINFKLLKENMKIIQADCLLTLDKLESSSVDCIITDPPYFLDGLESN